VNFDIARRPRRSSAPRWRRAYSRMISVTVYSLCAQAQPALEPTHQQLHTLGIFDFFQRDERAESAAVQLSMSQKGQNVKSL